MEKNNEIGVGIRKFLESKCITQTDVASSLGVSKQYVNGILSGRNVIGKTIAEKLEKHYGLSSMWLLTGKGNMTTTGNSDVPAKATGIPYYADVPVTAGQGDAMSINSDEGIVEYVNLPGIRGKYAFPVIGCSMEPIIHPGDFVVVDEIYSYERLDPDKIYLILTHEDRMIKHLETDADNANILWCVSPNYKRFSIEKSEVIKIYKVTFYGRFA